MNIRNYNNALAFTSLGVIIDHSVWGPKGIHTFRVCGELCHRIGSLLPAPDLQPAFAQIYIFDTDPQRQVDTRMSHHYNLLDRETLLQLQEMVAKHNPYFEAFKSAQERLAEHNNLSLHLRSVDAHGLDQRRYNRPTASEIAVLMVHTSEETTVTGTRDIVIQCRSGPLCRVSELHSSYCALRYPLIHVYGEQGWNTNMTHVVIREYALLLLHLTDA